MEVKEATLKLERIEKRPRRMGHQKCLRRVEINELHPRRGQDAELREDGNRNGEQNQN
jgi:hypothetical protein